MECLRLLELLQNKIKKNVLYEAMILALIAIPIGILCGLFADFILLKVIGTLLADALNNLKIYI